MKIGFFPQKLWKQKVVYRTLLKLQFGSENSFLLTGNICLFTVAIHLENTLFRQTVGQVDFLSVTGFRQVANGKFPDAVGTVKLQIQQIHDPI